MSAGFVGILTFDIHLPENGSLKGKRRDLKSLKAYLQHRFGASVAEVDHHDLWQRMLVTTSLVDRRASDLEHRLATSSAMSSPTSTARGSPTTPSSRRRTWTDDAPDAGQGTGSAGRRARAPGHLGGAR